MDPTSAIPLSPGPNVEQYRKLAKDLADAYRSGDAALATFVDRWIASIPLMLWAADEPHARQAANRAADRIEKFARLRLGQQWSEVEARLVVARSHGFLAWTDFVEHIARLAHGGDPFEAAVDAVIAGDERGLRRLVAADPGLVHARSRREHGATLLIYTSANGVESYRQRTPENIVRVAEILLDAGSDVNAVTHVYDGACTTLGLVATSAHPRVVGVQLPLLQLLIDRGARIEDGIAGGKAPAVLACLGNGCPEAAAYLAERGARVDLREAAGLGRLKTVERLLEGESATTQEINEGLRYASVYGQTAVAELLICRGADLTTTTIDGQTAAHMAAIGGHFDTLKMLLEHDPPLEQRNTYGGTVLGQTIWSAGHGGDPDRYIPIIDALLAAGAKLPDKHVPVNPQVDAFLAGKGSLPEPAWHWFGEKPRL
jgi:ankyrin repeat protein